MLRLALLSAAVLAVLATGTKPDPNNFPDPDVVATDRTVVPEAEPTPSEPPMRPLSAPLCGEEFNVTADGPLRGYFHSPAFPLAYPANLSCLWKIRGPPGFRLKLELRTVDTELNYDLLSVHAGLSPQAHSRVFTLSGRDSGRSVVFGSASASVLFSSDAYVSGGGFLATFRLLPQPDGELAVLGHSASLLSPGFPATFQPAATLRPAQALLLELKDAYAPAFRLLAANESHLARHSFLLNVTKGNGMYIRLPETELSSGATVEVADVAEGCDLDSPRSLSLDGNASLAQTLYSQCSAVRVTLLLPVGQDAKYRVEAEEVCQQWRCYGQYYLGRWALLSFNLMFFAFILSLLGCCCCCCDRLCRSPESERPRRRRSCRPAFANPAYERDAPALPTKAPISDA